MGGAAGVVGVVEAESGELTGRDQEEGSGALVGGAGGEFAVSHVLSISPLDTWRQWGLDSYFLVWCHRGCYTWGMSADHIAEREEARRIRRLAKAERVEGWAESRQRKADEREAKARQTADMIPMGQPIMVGHYSEGRHRRDIERMQDNTRAAIDHSRKAQAHASRAEGIRRWEEERLSAPVTIRRIAKLEAQERQAVRYLEGGYGQLHAGIEPRLAEIREELAYWRAHLGKLAAEGAKVWTREDFQVGDRVKAPHLGTVERVNAKSLTVRFDLMPQFTRTVRYDKVTGKVEE